MTFPAPKPAKIARNASISRRTARTPIIFKSVRNPQKRFRARDERMIIIARTSAGREFSARIGFDAKFVEIPTRSAPRLKPSKT